MAVTRVFGRADGVDIVFQSIEGNQWNIAVPFDMDCEYILELYAEDEAGNISFLTRALFTYDPKSLTLKVAPMQYGCKLLPEPCGVDISPSRKERIDIWTA
ncbi:Ig-like domain repeat protein [Hungatella hathewayi]|uniref:Ig-like domain-containing protein n=1 Tax=Hungatella hathewayi DSM 13479 TaxID=566550 RepID=D3ADE1_9FIRM|nr:PF13754 domain-containing protein [Hungatella hathewayi]EFD00191.1 hypothetical protein CLOSTHATH_01619 [Hungatella hathewayi DSM 13479]UWO83109.1 Ig-like domain repeat protein [Hungatella hathewayi]